MTGPLRLVSAVSAATRKTADPGSARSGRKDVGLFRP